jgi:hypothetical protein
MVAAVALVLIALLAAGCGGYGNDGGGTKSTPHSGTTTSGGDGY